MPDTLKQFYNASINVTGLTGNQTATLFTNNSTTRAVIKDVDVTNGFPVTPNLTVGGTAVASLGSNLTGSEIVDVSQAVAMSFASPLALTSATSIYCSNTSPNTYRSSTAFNINGNTVSTSTADQTLPASASSYTTFVYTAPDGDVFQVATNGDANNFLYKYAGSASGTQTTVNTGNTNTYSPIAFDGVSTFYWLTSLTNVRAFNANTETTTNITIDSLTYAATTAARLVFSNGYLFYVFIGNGDYPILIELSTGRWVYFVSGNTLMRIDNTSIVPGFWFDTTTRVATIFYYKASATAGYQRHVSPSLAAFTASSATITTAWTLTSLANASFVNTTPAAGSSTVSLSSADGGVILAANGGYPHTLSGISGPSSGWTLSLAPLATVDGTIFRPRAISSTSPTVNTTNFPSTISLRLTGVEVTA